MDTKFAFIVLKTNVVAGVIWVYGWLDRTGQSSPDPQWYQLTTMETVEKLAALDDYRLIQDKLNRA